MLNSIVNTQTLIKLDDLRRDITLIVNYVTDVKTDVAVVKKDVVEVKTSNEEIN